MSIKTMLSTEIVFCAPQSAWTDYGGRIPKRVLTALSDAPRGYLTAWHHHRHSK